MMQLGKPILILAVAALASGLAVVARRAPARADLTVWVFTEDNARTYRQEPPDGSGSLIDRFGERTGKSVRVDLIAQRALDARLMSLFMSGRASQPAPDLVEIDLASAGKFFRPPVSEIGLMPLNDFLAESGQLGKIVPARLVLWSKHGVIFGVPRDVHPVTLSYRKDLFDQAGVDLEAARTWDEFQEKCLEFQAYGAGHQNPGRMAMELFTTQSEELLLMLLQRHINIVDDQNHIHLTDPKVAGTVASYVQMVAGPRRIAADTIPGNALGYRDLADGNVCAMITPDWRTGYLKQYAPELAGKMRMRPLPVMEAGDAPTSTWGGTMMGIPRKARDPRASWELLQYLCLSGDGIAERHRYSEIIPPARDRWSDDIFQAGDPFFAGQKIEHLYIQLADKLPTRYMTPFSIYAQSAMTVVLNKAVGYVRDGGSMGGLESACSGWLAEAQTELEQWVDYGDVE